MIYYIAFVLLCGGVATALYYKNQHDKKLEIKHILQQYMVLDNQISPEEHTTL